MTQYVLRDMQSQAVQRCADFFLNGKPGRNSIAVCPTSFGKSLLISNVAAQLDAPVLVFQPSKEILEQNLSKFHAYGYRPSIYSASMKRKTVGEVTLATIGSVAGNKKRNSKAHLFQDFPYVIVDECDLVGAKSGMYKNFFDELEGVKILGVTATAWRMSSNSFGTMAKFLTRTRPRIFHDLVHFTQVQEMVEGENGIPFWAKLEYFKMFSDFDRHSVKANSTGADYDERALYLFQQKIGFQDKIVDVARRLKKAGRRNALIFTRFVKEAHYIASQMSDVVVVSADTPAAERDAIGKEFRSGRIWGVANVGVYCLDDNTEILTDSGWVGIDGMTKEHKVAGWKKDGTIEFASAENIMRRQRAEGEQMVSAKGKGKDFRVTSNHRMLSASFYGRQRIITWHDRAAIETVNQDITMPLSGIAEPHNLQLERVRLTPKQIRRREVALAYSLRQRGVGYEESNIEATETVARNNNFDPKSPTILTLDECLFIGFWLGDGSISDAKDGGRVCTITQSTVYPVIVRWIDDLLARLGFTGSRHRHQQQLSPNPAITWGIPRGTGSRGQSRLTGYYTIEPYLVKTGSQLLWGLNEDQFAALLHGFWMADGNHGDGVTPSEGGLSVTGAQKPLYDLLQAVGVCRGYSMNIQKQGAPRKPSHSQQYALHWRKENKRRFMRERPQAEDVWIPERVWCVTSSTGYIVTRRNGKVIVMGNSIGFDYPELDTIILGRLTKSLRLYYQMLGRLVRIHPDKESGYVVDLVGLTDEFGKIEDLKLYCEGESKWAVFGRPGGAEEQQLTNVYIGGTGDNRCKRCGQVILFWARHIRGLGSGGAPMQKPANGYKPNIAIRTIEGKTLYEVVGPDSPEATHINHFAVCGKHN